MHPISLSLSSLSLSLKVFLSNGVLYYGTRWRQTLTALSCPVAYPAALLGTLCPSHRCYPTGPCTLIDLQSLANRPPPSIANRPPPLVNQPPPPTLLLRNPLSPKRTFVSSKSYTPSKNLLPRCPDPSPLPALTLSLSVAQAKNAFLLRIATARSARQSANTLRFSLCVCLFACVCDTRLCVCVCVCVCTCTCTCTCVCMHVI